MKKQFNYCFSHKKIPMLFGMIIFSYLPMLHGQLLLVLAALVLEPDAHDARREARHLHQLLLHQGVGTRVCRVAGLQQAQLEFKGRGS